MLSFFIDEDISTCGSTQKFIWPSTSVSCAGVDYVKFFVALAFNEVPDLKICIFSRLHQIRLLLKQVLFQFFGKLKSWNIHELEMHKFRFLFLVQDAKMDFEFFCTCFLLHLFPVSQQRISTTFRRCGPFI